MRRVCYFCNKDMGEKDGGNIEEVFHIVSSGVKISGRKNNG